MTINVCYLSHPVALCYGSPGKLIQTQSGNAASEKSTGESGEMPLVRGSENLGLSTACPLAGMLFLLTSTLLTPSHPSCLCSGVTCKESPFQVILFKSRKSLSLGTANPISSFYFSPLHLPAFNVLFSFSFLIVFLPHKKISSMPEGIFPLLQASPAPRRVLTFSNCKWPL